MAVLQSNWAPLPRQLEINTILNAQVSNFNFSNQTLLYQDQFNTRIVVVAPVWVITMYRTGLN